MNYTSPTKLSSPTNTNCSTCNTTNPTFSKSQLKKKIDRKCIQCIEKLNNGRPPKNSSSKKSNVNVNMNNGAPNVNQSSVQHNDNDNTSSSSPQSTKKEKKRKKRKRSKKDDTVMNNNRLPLLLLLRTSKRIMRNVKLPYRNTFKLTTITI